MRYPGWEPDADAHCVGRKTVRNGVRRLGQHRIQHGVMTKHRFTETTMPLQLDFSLLTHAVKKMCAARCGHQW